MTEIDLRAARVQDSGEWRRRALRATLWCLGLGALVAAVVVLAVRLLLPHPGSTAALIVVAAFTLLGVAWFVFAALDRSNRRLGETERTLEQHRSIYEDFYVNANDVFYTADKDGVFQVFNPAGERLTGYRKGSDNPNLFDIVAPEYLPLVREMAARKADGTPRTAYELEVITKDGRRVPVEVSTRLIYDEEGREAGVHGVLRDISERRAAEQQIRESEARLSILIENIPEGMVLLNENLEIVRANAAASQLLEGHVDIIDGSLVRIADRPVEELLDLPPGNPSGVLEVGGPELTVLQVHGRRILGDAFQGGVLVVRDTTLERRVGEQVQQHARLAAVGELAAGVAHDFNNVLQGIAVIAQALGDEPALPAQAKSDVATIIHQTATGARVTRQLLDFSRQSPLTRRLVDLEEMLREVCPLLERSMPAKIAFTLDLPGSRVPVLADPALIQQMVANLVINARDAMPDGGHVDVRLSIVDSDTDSRVLPEEVHEGRWFELRVTDSGCGMTPEVRARALEPFFTTKERGAGTGLGLSQVYGIVQQHDGQLLIASQPGAGTSVSVLLPEHRESSNTSD